VGSKLNEKPGSGFSGNQQSNLFWADINRPALPTLDAAATDGVRFAICVLFWAAGMAALIDFLDEPWICRVSAKANDKAKRL